MSINYSYLKPPSNLKLQFDTKRNHNLNNQRLIFGNQNTYDANEQEGVHKIYQYIKKRRPNKQYSKSLLLKMYHLGNYDMQDSITKLLVYDQWHKDELILNEKIKNILQSGVFYQYGKDQDYHPIIYFRPNRIFLDKSPHYFTINDYQQALRNFLNPIQQYMMIPGVIEKWILVVDLERQKINIPIDLAIKNIETIAIAYPYRLQKILFVNVSKNSLTFINSLAQSVSKKIIDLSSPKTSVINTLSELTHYIPILQREKKYGGTLNNLQVYWPITITNKLFEYSQESIDGEHETQFQSIMNEADFDIQRSLSDHGLCSSCNII